MEIGFTLADLSHGLPLIAPVLYALLLLCLEAAAPGRLRSLAGWTALAALALAFLWTLGSLEGLRGINELDPVRQGRTTHLFCGMFVVDTPHLMGHLLILGSALFSGLLALPFLKARGEAAGIPAFSALLLLAAAGGMLMISGASLLLCFLGMELLSLCLCVLAALRPGRREGLEAGLKHFLIGAFAAALFAFGLALLYAGRGSVDLALFRIQWVERPEVTGMAGLGATLILAALFSKASVFPFQACAPAVHQGLAAPIVPLFSGAMQAAAFVLMMAMAGLVPAEIRYAVPVIALAAAAAGVLGALRARDLKRLLAFSAAAHAGFLLVGLNSVLSAENWPDAWQSVRGVFFYLVAYLLAAAGALGIVAWLERGAGRGLRLEELAGLGGRHPWAAGLLALCLLSLGGAPLTAGFWARFYLFSQAIRQGFIVLSVLGLLLSAACLMAYLRIIHTVYMRPAEREDFAPAPAAPEILAIALSAAGLLLFGLLDPSMLFLFLFGLQI